jgi:hypothetical protein
MKYQIYIDACDSDELLDAKTELFNYLFHKVFPKQSVFMLAKCHGWRGVDGYRHTRKYDSGAHILRSLNCGNATSFKIFSGVNKEYGRHIAINTAHHDSPCWKEWTYLIRPEKIKNSY